jgi:mRNA-degrading endonuclease RelE of RelBE toxin-antitoxin system
MKLEYSRSFERDLRDARHAPEFAQLRRAIEILKTAPDLRAVPNTKKLQGGENYYRIRVGDYRIGAVLEGDTLVLVRFMHRKDIYRSFP